MVLKRPETAPKTTVRIFNWGARALYVGPALNLSAHRNAVAVLAVGLEAAFKVARNPGDSSAGYVSCRSVVIPPNTLHHLTDTLGAMAFLYVDARSDDVHRLLKQARLRVPGAAFHLTCEDDVISGLGMLHRREVAWSETRSVLCQSLGLPGDRNIDPRVQEALRLLHANPSARLSLPEIAAHIGLSPSRLIHLFKQTTGVPLRRYKLWLAMGAAMRSLAKGENLTVAAMNGGFSSAAHFSSSFREMFGLEPSRLRRDPERSSSVQNSSRA